MRNVTRSLRVLAVVLLSALAFATQVNAQVTLFTESFESAGTGTTTPPSGWATDVLAGSNAVYFQSAGTWPTCTPYNGTRFVEFQSFNYSNASDRLRMTTPVSTVGYTNVGVDFQWLEDNGYPGTPDSVGVWWSTNGTTWNWGGANYWRYLNIPSPAWYLKTVALPAGAAGQPTLYIAFHFFSAYGNNCHLDFMHITAVGPPPPATVTVGTGSNSCQWPYSTYWMGGRTQMLYTAAEILAAGGGPGLISQIGFNVTSYYNQTMQSFNINFQSTTATSLTGWVNSGWTNAYSGTYAVTGTGWQMITLQTPYVWTGDNLLMEVCYGSNGSYTYYSFVTGTTTPTNTVYHYEMDNQTGCSMTSGSAYNNRPNLRFVEQPYVGTVTGTVTDSYNSAPLTGATVTVQGMTPATTAGGLYTVYNVPIGNKTVTASMTNYLTKVKSTTVQNNQTSTVDFALDPIPGVLSGIVTNAATGQPEVGAKIFAANGSVAYSVAGGVYTLNVYPVGTFSITASKAGFNNFTAGPFTFVQGATILQDIPLLEDLNPPALVVAELNATETEADINWSVPYGLMEILYDDGICDNFTVWAVAGNENAVKFTPVGYPATLMGGSVHIGGADNYPAGANPLVPFKIAVLDASGPGGTPGLGIDTIDVSPPALGWVTFTFPNPMVFNSGSFYLVMIQGGDFPDAAGLCIDETSPQLRSYARFATGSGPWVPASGNFMMRAVVYGSGGPLDLDLLQPQHVTATAVPNAIYNHTPKTVSGLQGKGKFNPVNWSDYAQVQVPQTTKPSAPPAGQTQLTDPGMGSTFDGTTVPLQASDIILYDNGPLVNSVGTGFGGADESVIQAPLNNNGFNMINGTFYLADQFTVGGDGWLVTSMDFYGYQTGSTTTSTFTGIYVSIWNGKPGTAGASVIWGDQTTNRLASSTFSNIYRVSAPNGGVSRPIMKITASIPGLTLAPGTYWVEWSATGTLASGPWNPPITINNTPTTGDAIQWTGASWDPLITATYPQGLPFVVKGNAISPPGNINYQVWRLKQGDELNTGLWASLGTTNTTSWVDGAWPTLTCGPWRWAVEAIYTGNRFSAPAFSNVIGKCWTANVTINVTLTCAANPKAGTQVKLQNNAYPDTLYLGVTDTNGIVVFPTVWKGNYTLTTSRFSYPVTTQVVDIMGDMTINVVMLQDKTPPTNLFVDSKTLEAIWNAPHVAFTLLNEDFTGGYATNNWVEDPSNSNWQPYPYDGHPAPSVEFYYYPTQTNYSQTLTSKTFTGLHAPQQLLKFDIYLSNFSTATVENLTVEVWDGSSWNQVANYDNQSGNISWSTKTVDISAYTDINFKVRFNANGENSYNINYWYLDNVQILASDGIVGLNPCVLGYNFYLNGVTTGFTTDTTYVIPSTLVTYGQTYNACVAAVYGSGYSTQACYQFTSSFLCPVADLTATAVENSAYLTWSKPQCTGGEPKCYVYDDGTMENGWTYNPGYNLWLGNQFTAPATDQGVINEFKILWWNNPNATNQTLTIDMFSLTGVLLGTTQPFTYTIPAPSTYQVVTVTTPIPFTGPFYGMLHYNNFSGLTHWVGYDQTTGQGGTFNLGYAYDGATFTSWNNYAGAGQGTFCIQACGLVNSDNSGMVPVTYGNIPPAGNAPASAGILSHSPEGETAPPAATPPPTAESDNLLVGTGLLGYNVYIHEGSFVQYVPGPDSLSTYVFNLDPGTYCFDVKAYYDLTVYGFPGQFDESMPIGPACVDLMYGRPLPFFEPWDQGSFGYNDWTFAPLQGNWTMNTGEGNPLPSADFSWQPVQSNYEFSLESPVLNAGPWTCASLWLDFDYKLVDRNATGNESLFAEVLYGGTWHQKAEFTNNGSTNWMPQHFDISGAQGKALKVRFRAAGASSDDILHWYVDNIHIYGICNSPTGLTASQSHENVTLTWSPPECTGGGGGVVMQFIFDDGTAENGWAINPGYSQWIGNEFPIAATYQGVIQSFDVFFYYTPPGPDMMTIDIFDATQTVVGTSDPFAQPDNTWATVLVNDVPFAGMFYGMVHWNMVGSPTNYLGIDEDGPYSGQDLEWYFDGTTWDKFSNMGYNGGVMLVRATALVGGDLKKVTIVPGQKPTGHITNTAALRKSDAKADTKNYTQMGPVLDNDSSQIIGYNVYRTDLGAQPPYNKLNSAPVTATTYLDVLPNASNSDYGQYKYYVTAVFNDSQTNLFLCESPGLDTIMIQFPAVGIDPIGKESVQIYPNPATQFVNVKSTIEIGSIEVMNFVGQTVALMNNVGSKTARLDISTISAGVYFVKVTTSEGIRTAKITVTR